VKKFVLKPNAKDDSFNVRKVKALCLAHNFLTECVEKSNRVTGPYNQFGTPAVAESFLRGAQIF